MVLKSPDALLDGLSALVVPRKVDWNSFLNPGENNEGGFTEEVAEACFLSVLDEGLDKALGGGICTSGGALTEFVGEAGVGKSQWALHLCLACAKQGKKALLISTEGAIPMERMEGMASGMMSGNQMASRSVLGKIYTHELSTMSELAEYIVDTLPRMLMVQGGVGLIVIDSITALFRAGVSSSSEISKSCEILTTVNHGEFARTGSRGMQRAGFEGGVDAARQVEVLMRLVGRLKRLAASQGAGLVVINQVGEGNYVDDSDKAAWTGVGGTVMGVGGKGLGSMTGSAGSSSIVTPALGLSWAQCVNTRVMLSRTASSDPSRTAAVVSGMVTGEDATGLRRLELGFCPHFGAESRDAAVHHDDDTFLGSKISSGSLWRITASGITSE